jgi:hypothetical protein
MVRNLLIAFSICGLSLVQADDSDRLLSVNHYVRVDSTVPAISGQITQIYVREAVRAGIALRQGALGDHVVLFIHGAGTPAEVAFDVPFKDYRLDGLSGARGLRRIFDGHDRLWALDTARGDGRSVQSLARAAVDVCAGAAGETV